jgi:hypothetical protein
MVYGSGVKMMAAFTPRPESLTRIGDLRREIVVMVELRGIEPLTS